MEPNPQRPTFLTSKGVASGDIPEHWRIRARASTASDACHQPMEPPLAGDAFQLVFAGIRVPEAGADGEILDCLRHEHVAWTRTRRHTCADRDGDPSDLRVDELHFACVDTNSHGDAQRPDGVDNRLRAANRAGRPVERGKEAVTRGIDLGSPVSTD